MQNFIGVGTSEANQRGAYTMRFLRWLGVASLILALAGSDAAAAVKPGVKPDRRAPHRAASTIDNATRMDANNIDMIVTNHGSFAEDLHNQAAGFFYPKGSTKTAVFAAGPWIGAKVNGRIVPLKSRLKNGDIVYDYLDPDTYMEIRIERQQFIRGSVRETLSELGSYKQVAGVYYPFSIEKGPKADPTARTKITVDKIEINVPLDESAFKMPGAAPVSSPQTHPQPPAAPEPKKPPKSSGRERI